MEDRFKFRCFNPEDKTMHYTDFIVTATGFISRLEQQNHRIFYIDNQNLDLDKNLILMQCTGLKDCEGKLIYEGDIITGEQLGQFGKSMDDYKGQVIFKDGCFMVSYNMMRSKWHQSIGNDLLCNFMNLKVIGNIYQDKHLLEPTP